MSTLVVSATEGLAAHVPHGLQVVVVGQGKTTVAARIARVLGEAPGITEVVSIGTALSLRDGLSGLQLPGTVFNHEISTDALRVLGYDPMEQIALPGGDELVLASGDVLVTDPVVRTRLATVAHLMDTEGYAVAWTCRTFGVPARLVRHVRDDDGADPVAVGCVEQDAQVLGSWLADHVSVIPP